MFKRSTWLHLRIPFSFFLMPVFMFALAVSGDAEIWRVILVFVSIHLFLYPASNGYNSYFDKDEKSIGGLKNPPPVEKELYRAALLFDGIAIAIGLFVNWEFALMLFIYGLVSKAYSHPMIRLKKYPFLSWFIAGLFQGAFTYVMGVVGLKNLDFLDINNAIFYPALLSSVLLWGSYPMTQIYQHEEDSKRGDITLSIKLGIKGTFVFTALVFGVASGLYWLYFETYFSESIALMFVALMAPIVIFFGWWFLLVLKDEQHADFTNTMRLNFISAFCLNAFFGWMCFP